jgi:hypothetical protein
MVHEMITLPLRIGVRATRFGVLLAGGFVVAALRTGEALIEVARPELHAPSGETEQTVATHRIGVGIVLRPRPATATAPAAAPAPARRSAEREPAADAPTAALAPADVPDADAAPAPHVSEEPRLVATSADAEDGPGATVHVAEPWDGYAGMTARQVVARLSDASPEELATVELYEQGHGGRRTVMTAADRRLRRATTAAPAAA